MPTSGAYEFKLSAAAKGGMVQEAIEIEPGAWAWYEVKTEGQPTFLGIFTCCPDCKQPMTVWRRFGDDVKGHRLDADGSLYPSVLHTWQVEGIEQCGFHTQPTRLLGFTDLR